MDFTLQRKSAGSVGLWIVLTAFLLIVLSWSIHNEFDHDELEVIHTSWKIYQGEHIYIDFFQHHHPLLYYLLVPVIAFNGEQVSTLLITRVILYMLYVCILAVTYLLGRKIFNSTTAAISLILLSTSLMYTKNAIEVRPDVPQTLFCLISIYFLFVFLDKTKRWSLVASGLAAGIALLFLQKAVVFVFLGTTILLTELYRRKTTFRDLLIYLAFCFLPLGLYLLYLQLNQQLGSYFFFNWILNAHFIDREYPWQTLLVSYQENPFLWLFFILGLCFCLKTRSQKQLGWAALGTLVFIIATKKPHQQYFIPLIPLIAILSAHGLQSLFHQNKRIIFVVLFLASFYPSLVFIDGAFKLNNEEQLQKINYVLSVTKPNDHVYDGDILFNVFRKDIDFFWYSLDRQDGLETYQSLRPYDYDIYESIERYQPRVISTYYIQNLADPRIQNFYQRSANYPDLLLRKSNP